VATETAEHLDAVLLGERKGATVCAAFEPRSWVRAGDVVHLTAPPNRLHFFDPESERAITAATPG
jgi:hypothetical protein